jgi:hypothetical protein
MTTGIVPPAWTMLRATLNAAILNTECRSIPDETVGHGLTTDVEAFHFGRGDADGCLIDGGVETAIRLMIMAWSVSGRPRQSA